MDYKETKAYQNMSASQKAFFDYTDEAGTYGGKRKAKEDAQA